MDWHKIVFHQGNEELKRFIEIGVVAVRLGIPVHFHVEGVRGTGKTTLIRAAKSRHYKAGKKSDQCRKQVNNLAASVCLFCCIGNYFIFGKLRSYARGMFWGIPPYSCGVQRDRQVRLRGGSP